MILSDEQQAIRDAARSFAQDNLAPLAGKWERDAMFPREALRAMGELGFLGMTVPSRWDGAEVDYVAYAAALMEIAAGSGAVSTIMAVHNGVGCMPLVTFGNNEQREEFLRPMARGERLACFCLTEPHAGSDAASIRTRARRDGADYVISGSKQFITSGKNADVAIVFAVTDPAAGKRGLSAFIVPTNTRGFQVLRVEEKLGQHASDTCALSFEEMRVPSRFLLGEEGQGLRIALANLEGGRIGIAAQATGMARAAYEAALAYSQERKQFGKPIVEHQAVAFRLADMATRLEAAEQLTFHAAALRDAGRPCLKEASMAKLFAAEIAEKVCSDAIQIHGGYGYLADYPVERIYRDVRVCQIYEGTSDVQRLVISRSLAAS
ncbi:MAG: acyl-CoA dehydrogenase family protein [Proteobacteria bacterium]|nr:acyl-CoA dehydrogenase family protein [Pseudomonadota bacterium]